MNKKTIIALLVVLAVVLLSTFYVELVLPATFNSTKDTTEVNSSIDSSKNVTVYSPIYQNLQLSISFDTNKTVFRLGEEIKLTITLKNVSNQTVNLPLVKAPEETFNFLVFPHNNNGTSIFEWVHGAFYPFNKTVTLAPNENYTNAFIWKQNGNLDVPSQVHSGEYDIIGGVWSSDLWNNRYLVTAPLNITITN